MQEGFFIGFLWCHVQSCGLLHRREDDGTFVVLMQSVEHPDAPLREAPFYNWRAPIRAQVWGLLLSCSSHRFSCPAVLHSLPIAAARGNSSVPSPAEGVVGTQIEFSGYTLAPLQPQFTNHYNSQETLITHVIKARLCLHLGLCTHWLNHGGGMAI